MKLSGLMASVAVFKGRIHMPVSPSLLRLSIIALMVTPGLALSQAEKPDCQCRAPGGVMRDLGTIECVEIGGKQHLVVCDMSTNTPYWRKVDGTSGCPAV